MSWVPIDSDDAVRHLMDRFNWFHDACLRDASLVTTTFIDADGFLDDDGRLDTGAVLFFQSQGAPDRAIEIQCTGLSLFKIVPTGDNRDSKLSTARFGLSSAGCQLGLYFVGLPLKAEPNSVLHRRVDPEHEHPAIEIVAVSMAWRAVADGLGPVVRHRRVDP